MHWDYFQEDNSKSTVAAAFLGKLELNGAYELNPHFLNWQSGSSHVAIYVNNRGVNLPEVAKAFNQLRADKNLNNAIILVTDKWIMEYRSYKSQNHQFKALPLIMLEETKLPTLTLIDLKSPVKIQEGVNFKF